MPTKFSGVLYITIIFLSACTSQVTEDTIDQAYQSEIEQWRAERVERLKRPDSWLSLAGLYFLKEGPNTFGSSPENKLVFPEKAPKKMGTIWLEGGLLKLEVNNALEILLNDSLVAKSPVAVHSEQTPAIMEWASLSWYVMQREDRFLVRLKDAKNEVFEHFSSIGQFPIDKKWKVSAQFINRPQQLAVKNVLDMNVAQESEGILRFEMAGKPFELTVLDGGEKDYFIIFADHTTGEETYGGGRYLYTPKADSTGYTFLDFNKAYNPPCVFTPYATCLLPPPQNRLDVAILAGEKTYGEH